LSLSLAATALASVLAPSASIGDWIAGPELSRARDGASSVVLGYGSVFVSGGEGPSGITSSAEVLDASGAFTSVAPMLLERRDHASVRLPDGRVLVIGGTTATGATASAEVYDPSSDAWSPSGSLAGPRSGATAVLLDDERVLVVGGDGGGAALELFDPTTGAFSSSAATLSPRTDLAAAKLRDGRILIVGGADGATVTSFSEIYDPLSDSLAAGPDMQAPRAGHTATRLLDGNVLVAGGHDGAGDLGSAEVYVVDAGVFVPTTGGLFTARRDHLALTLPHNGSVLIVGGTLGGAGLTSAERFLPWTNAFVSAGSLSALRPGAAGSPRGVDGWALVAGGGGLWTSEMYGFATVATERQDYLPGDTAEITGTGFAPFDTVTLQVTHVTGGSCCGSGHLPWDVTADGTGGFSSSWYVNPDDSANSIFRLTADSGVEHAETVFVDLPRVTAVAVGAQSPNPVVTPGSATYTVTVSKNPSFLAAMSTNLSMAGLPTGASASFSPNPVSFPAGSNLPRTSTLTISTSCCTPNGPNPFTVTAALVGNPADTASGNGTLSVTGDTTPPTISAPGADATIECPSAPVFTAPSASDACDASPSVVELGDVTTPGACPGSYTRTKTWQAVDCSGNASATVSQTITVVDTTAPSIGAPGADATIECPSAPVFTAPSASDACDASPSVVELGDVTTPGACPGSYTRTKTWQAVDCSGNASATVSQTITVVDTTAPSIGAPGADATIEGPATPVFTAPGASDACDASPAVIEVSDVTTPGACPGSYTRTKTWRAVDCAGNLSGTVNQTITIADTTAPSIGSPGPDTTIQVPSTPVFTAPTASDALDPSPTVVEVSDVTTPGSGGSYTRTKTWQAFDCAGNASGTVSQTISVVNASPPTITISSPANSAVFLLNQPVQASFAAAGNCTGAITVTGTVGSGQPIDTGSVGMKSFTVTATDSCGNTSSVTHTYLVQYAPIGTSCMVNNSLEPGHQILQPINPDGSSSFKKGRTVPCKFRVFDANCASIGTPGVVTSFVLYATSIGAPGVNEEVVSTTPDTQFRWDSEEQQWIFNLATKNLSSLKTYYYRITLNDGTSIEFRFGLR
jgi:hypothetical protein